MKELCACDRIGKGKKILNNKEFIKKQNRKPFKTPTLENCYNNINTRKFSL